jgi:DNA-binding MarR family transcriptional regulator
MGATLAGLEARDLVERRSDPEDGRLVVISATDAGLRALRDRRNAGTQQLRQVLATQFTRSELKQLTAAAPLIERLAESL